MNLRPLIFLTCLLLTVYLILRKYFQKLIYWKQHNVDTLGFLKLFLASRKSHVSLVLNGVYGKMCSNDKPLAAIENVFFSVVIVRDLEAIKAIMTSNYENFPDRGLYVNNRDPLSMNIARLEYERWKPLRQKINSVYTPAKIKSMFPTLLEISTKFVEFLKADIEGGTTEMEFLDLGLRFNIDVIGNVAFGIECNSLKEPNSEFRMQSEKVFKDSLPPFLEHIGAKYPKLLNFFHINVYPKDVNEFFTRIVRETVEYREKHHIRRNDAMDAFIELKKSHELGGGGRTSLDFIAAQVFAFYLAGSQSSAKTLSFALFELARNPAMQTKARNSVIEQLSRHNNQLTYDSVQDMVYLKQIIQETLRKYPLGATQPRICRRSCSLPTAKGSYHIEAGTLMAIPIYAIHHDPLYYPEPEQFRPERFDEHELAQRPADANMSFGIGPKACPADLFAKINLIVVLALLLLNFQFFSCDRTPIELEFDPKNLYFLSVKNGIHLKVKSV